MTAEQEQRLGDQLARVNAYPVSRQEYQAEDRTRRGVIDPRFASPAKGLGFNYLHWLGLPGWSKYEAVLLLSRRPGADALIRVRHRPFEATVEIHFRRDPARVLDKFERSIAVGDISDPARPGEWIALALRLGLAIPRELRPTPSAKIPPATPISGAPTRRRGQYKKGLRIYIERAITPESLAKRISGETILEAYVAHCDRETRPHGLPENRRSAIGLAEAIRDEVLKARQIRPASAAK